jgi:enoyl-[acyl-carrier protein] reductase I
VSHWLGLEKKTFAVFGIANKKSVGWHVGRALQEAGARVLWVVHTESRRAELAGLLGREDVFVCDVARQAEIDELAETWSAGGIVLSGLLHSIARADYTQGPRPFHDTDREDFLRAVDVSAFSLVALCGALAPRFDADASVVAISISTTRMAAENYGFMAPAKAALDSAVVFLAKSLKQRGRIRVNAVCAGLLRTSASAGIPGYVESLLFAEQSTLRKKSLATSEVADAALFLLSPRSTGIDAQGIVVDAGMAVNHFDRAIVEKATAVPEVERP